MNASNAYNVYKNNSINYASKEQLLLMLLDGAVKFTKISRQAIIDKNVQKAHINIRKAQDIFYELMITLDLNHAGEWGQQLMSIYEFTASRLGEANIRKDVQVIDEILPLIEDLRDTWEQAYKISKVNK